MYVFDRVTGQPLWPIEERPVPKGDVPGEYYSPTQPFPLNGRGQPFKYDRQGFVEDDLIDFTPELRAEGRKVISRYKIRSDLHAAGRQQGRRAAGDAGARGRGWRNELAGRLVRSGNEHPVCELAEVGQPARTRAAARSVEERSRVRDRQRDDRRENDWWNRIGCGRRKPAVAPGTPAAAAAAAPAGEGGGGAPALNVRGLPIMKPPYGQLSAIDLGKGEILWQVPHGDTPDSIRNHAALKGLNIPRTGRPGVVGSLTTKTLVISGEAGFGPTPTGARGAMLRAVRQGDRQGSRSGRIFPRPKPARR